MKRALALNFQPALCRPYQNQRSSDSNRLHRETLRGRCPHRLVSQMQPVIVGCEVWIAVIARILCEVRESRPRELPFRFFLGAVPFSNEGLKSNTEITRFLANLFVRKPGNG